VHIRVAFAEREERGAKKKKGGEKDGGSDHRQKAGIRGVKHIKNRKGGGGE